MVFLVKQLLRQLLSVGHRGYQGIILLQKCFDIFTFFFRSQWGKKYFASFFPRFSPKKVKTFTLDLRHLSVFKAE